MEQTIMVNHVSHNNVMDQYVTKLYRAKFLQFFFFLATQRSLWDLSSPTTRTERMPPAVEVQES